MRGGQDRIFKSVVHIDFHEKVVFEQSVEKSKGGACQAEVHARQRCMPGRGKGL